MQDQPTLASEKESEGGIASTVKLYVRLKNISALSKLKVHRLELMSQHADTEHFSFRPFHEHCQKDISAIDAGLHELLKNEPLRGNVDVFSFKRIAGWAQYVRHPEIPVTLGIYFNKEHAVQVVANRYRPDLKAAKLGSGHHSFEFVPWKLFLSSEVIEIKAPNGKVIGTWRKPGSARADESVSLQEATKRFP
jgi:hypothetical protein